jgi:hypothetical protein
MYLRKFICSPEHYKRGGPSDLHIKKELARIGDRDMAILITELDVAEEFLAGG